MHDRWIDTGRRTGIRTSLAHAAQALAFVALLLCLFGAGPATATPPPLFHSPADDGTNAGVPAMLTGGQTLTLHLYLGIGTSASTAEPCHQGDGDEICGHLLKLSATGAIFDTFTPADPDLLFDLAPGQLAMTGGDFQTGELGPTKLGDLVLTASAGGGEVTLETGEFVTTQLAKETTATPMAIVLLPEPAHGLLVGTGSIALALLGRRARRRPRC